MKRFPFFVCLVFLLLLVQAGFGSAAVTTAIPEPAGGSVYFETDPKGAMIWLDNTELGTSPFTYYFIENGTRDVLIRKKGYEDYTDKVTIIDGQKIIFSAVLIPVIYDITDKSTPAAAPITTAMIIRKPTMTIPTPWPTRIPESPGDPAVVIVAVAIGIGFLVIRR